MSPLNEESIPSTARIRVSEEEIASFCRRWKIRELSFFGSVLREDFRADSDIDALVTFGPDADWSLLDVIGAELELSDLLGRPVHLANRTSIERSDNWIRRQAILSTARRFYAAR